jgi:hypothetical protein
MASSRGLLSRSQVAVTPVPVLAAASKVAFSPGAQRQPCILFVKESPAILNK